ncbi:MAG: DUF2202 domain-containing protein [Candidatus Nanopelagicales bacterium]
MTTRQTALAATAGAGAMALIAAGILMGSAQAQPLSTTAAAPVAATHGNGAGNGLHDGTGLQNGSTRNGSGSHGTTMGAGQHGTAQSATGRGAANRATGTRAVAPVSLTAAQKADLQSMAEEEKLAGDVYAALAAQYDDSELAAIAAAEDRHAASLRTLLVRYGIADPTAGYAEGAFPTPAMQSLYDDLLARGSVSLSAAYAVGADIERMDIDDLGDAITRASGITDITRVYTNLRTGSQHHLAAFTA